MGNRWAAELFAAVLPPSKFKNVFIGHRDAVAAQLVRSVMSRRDNLGRIIERVTAAYGLLDDAFHRDPKRIAAVVESTFRYMGELQERESTLEGRIHAVSDGELEARFGSYLELYEFTHEQYYRTLAAPYVAAHAITRTGEALIDLIDGDGRVEPFRMAAIEAGRDIKPGVLTEGLNRHLRNSAAHHRYSILDDDRVRLWDVNRGGDYTWGPVEWKFWDLRTNVYLLSNTCSVLLLGIALFDISYSPTIRARGWGMTERPRPKRRDIAKSELTGMADVHGLTVEKVEVTRDGVLAISLKVKGETITEQTTKIVSGGDRIAEHFLQEVRTEWGPLRGQVYGFLQTTFDVHGGYDSVRVTVVAKDGKANLGTVEAPVAERLALIKGNEPIEAIRARLPVDTLTEENIPVIIKGPIVPIARVPMPNLD